MIVDLYDTHDRLIHFKNNQSENILTGCEECLKKNQDSISLQDKSPYIYIFAHARTSDEGSGKRMLWQPRLSKPTPQTNSFLFRVRSKTDEIEICWMIPPRELWPQYKKGNITESDIVSWSIDQFTNNRKKLAASYEDDLSPEQIKNIWIAIAKEKEDKIQAEKLSTKPKTLEVFQRTYEKL